MKRAVELFALEARTSWSPLVEETWQTRSEPAEFFGIEFSVGTFMRDLPPGGLVDRTLTLPQVSDRSFWLDGSAWELPGLDNADVFVDRLIHAGLLVHDPIVPEALHGEVAGFSTRSVERRVARAVELLSRGVPASDVARRAGYADQPHLTRSLKRFVGQTPSQIVGSGVGQ